MRTSIATSGMSLVLFSMTWLFSAALAQQPLLPKKQSARIPSADRSPIVYPTRDSPLLMTHATDTHKSLACERCHNSVPRSDTVRDNLVPPESSCEPCHSDKLDRTKPTSENCGFCHRDSNPSRPGLVAAAVVPVSRLHFSHKRHSVRATNCLQCHSEIATASAGSGKGLPKMETCNRCHRDNRASVKCATCHWSTPAGLLITRFSEGELKPYRSLGDTAHGADWTVRHRWVAADQGAVCASCHSESACTKCHNGSQRPKTVHPNDWLTLHPQQSRRDSPRCTSCHTTQTFCAECHARLGVSQLAAPDVRSGARFHPLTNQWTRGSNRHATEAKRSLSACVSCHRERDCVRCHGRTNRLGAHAPHPPGFSKKCESLLNANSRACKSCHGKGDRFLDRCE